jgi:hypothetical protein
MSNNGIGSVILIGTLLQINVALANPAALMYRSAGIKQSKQPAPTLSSNKTRGPEQPVLGANLHGPVDWSSAWTFVDAFKLSRVWIPQQEGKSWGQGEPIAVDANGWVTSLKPGQFAETVMFTGGKHYPVGMYTLLYDGEGKITFREGGSLKVVSQTPGRMRVDVRSHDDGVFLQIRETNPANPVRNIRFIMPGFENTYQQQPFHPLFLERIAKFKVLRFMDWGATNHSTVKEWSDRTTLNSARQTENGIALEYMIQLANTLKIDPWFTLPHQASDDYVRKFATMVRDRLDPSLKPYVEYSNEVWNWSFKQTHYAAEKGTELGLRDAGDGDGGKAMLRYYAQRSVEIFKIWREVFGGTERIVEVLGIQGGNTWAGEQVLTWNNAYQYADTYSIASYFSGYGSKSGLVEPQNVDKVLQMTPEQILDKMQMDIEHDRKGWIETRDLARRYGLTLTAYEGGVHLLSWNMPADKEPRVTELFKAVNRHPRMRELYRQYLNQWKEIGGGVLNQFTDVGGYSKYGFWGALEYQNQDISEAPKYQALMEYIEQNHP